MDIEKEKIRIREEREKIDKRESFFDDKKEVIPDKETFKEEKEKEIRKKLSNLKKNVSSSPLSTRDEKKEIEKMSYPEKIGALISLSFEKGIEEATSIAISLNDPSLVDEFHDTLVDQYKERLIKEGIINGVKNKKGKVNKFVFLIILIIIISFIFLIFSLF